MCHIIGFSTTLSMSSVRIILFSWGLIYDQLSFIYTTFISIEVSYIVFPEIVYLHKLTISLISVDEDGVGTLPGALDKRALL